MRSMENITEHLCKMTLGYLTCALFTDLPEEKVGSGEFDASPFLPRITKQTKAEATTVCAVFLKENAADLASYRPDIAGMDLWYTRNGHGCGFWDRRTDCTDEQGDRLSEAARKLGEAHLFGNRGRYIIE